MDLRCEDDCVSKGVRTEEVGKFAVEGRGLLSRQPRWGLGAKGEEVRDLHRRIKGQQNTSPHVVLHGAMCSSTSQPIGSHTHTLQLFFLSTSAVTAMSKKCHTRPLLANWRSILVQLRCREGSPASTPIYSGA